MQLPLQNFRKNVHKSLIHMETASPKMRNRHFGVELGGAGPTYAKFFKERSTATLSGLTGGTPANPTTLSVESKLVPTIQLGGTWTLNERWFVDAMVAKTFLKTRTTLSTGQTLDIKLDPVTVSVAVGMRF